MVGVMAGVPIRCAAALGQAPSITFLNNSVDIHSRIQRAMNDAEAASVKIDTTGISTGFLGDSSRFAEYLYFVGMICGSSRPRVRLAPRWQKRRRYSTDQAKN